MLLCWTVCFYSTGQAVLKGELSKSFLVMVSLVYNEDVQQQKY